MPAASAHTARLAGRPRRRERLWNEAAGLDICMGRAPRMHRHSGRATAQAELPRDAQAIPPGNQHEVKLVTPADVRPRDDAASRVEDSHKSSPTRAFPGLRGRWAALEDDRADDRPCRTGCQRGRREVTTPVLAWSAAWFTAPGKHRCKSKEREETFHDLSDLRRGSCIFHIPPSRPGRGTTCHCAAAS